MKTKFLRNIALAAALVTGVCTGAQAAGIGLHMGSDSYITQYNDFSKWLGKDVMYRVTFVDQSSWSTIASPYYFSTSTKAWLASNPNRYEIVTVPLMPISDSPSTLAAVANGTYDTYFKQLAANLAAKTGAPQRVVIRLGWELNGTWYPWSAVTSGAATYVKAYRHVVQVMRSQCNVLHFEWNLAWGSSPKFDWTTAYPGDDVVDVIGMDTYDQWNTGWNNILNGYEGLAFLRNFARQHNKPEAYTEWADSTASSGRGDDTAFVQGMHDWIQAGGSSVIYAGYWNTPSGGPNGVIYSDVATIPVTVPNSSALYKKLFSQ